MQCMACFARRAGSTGTSKPGEEKKERQQAGMCILRFWHTNQCQSHPTYLRCWTCLSCNVMRSLCNVARHQCRKPATAATIPALCAECGSLQERQLCLRAATAAGCCPARQQVQQGDVAASTAEQSAQLDASLDTLQKVLSDNRVAPFLTVGDYEHGLWSHVRPQLCRYETLLPFSCQGSEGQNKVINQDRARNDMRGGCGVSRTGGLYRRQRTKQCNELVLSGFEDS